MYEPFPVGGQPPERPEPPASVLTAVKLMYAGAGLEALGLILNLTDVGQLGILQAFTPVIGIALWLWMAAANKAGKDWARVTSTVLFGLDSLLVLFVLVGIGALASSGMTAVLVGVLLAVIVIWLLGLGTIVMLWRKDSSDYFRAMKEY